MAQEAATQPSHLITESMVKAALAEEFGVDAKDVRVRSFEVTGGSNPGDNYACDLKAVTAVADVRGRQAGSTYHYMAKCLSMNEERNKLLRETGMFKTEAIMYAELMPRLKEMDARLSSPLTFYADCDVGVMMMENLKKLDYFLVDKLVGLDMSEVKLVLTQLALLHSTSYHLLQTYNGGEEKFLEKYPTLNNNMWTTPLTEQMRETMDTLMGNIAESSQLIVEEFKPDLLQRVKDFDADVKAKLDACHARTGKFNCIIHNDSWNNNYLFRKGKGGDVTTEVKMLDLQGSRIARPSVDLAYFFGASTRPMFRKEHLKSLLKFYHDIFAAKLNELGYDSDEVYSFSDLMKDFRECMSFGFVTARMHTMVQLTDPDNPDKFDMDAMLGDDKGDANRRFVQGQLREARKNLVHRERVVQIVEEAAELGVI